MIISLKKQVLWLPLTLLLGGCAGLYERGIDDADSGMPTERQAGSIVTDGRSMEDAASVEVQPSAAAKIVGPVSRIYPGSGRFINNPRPAPATPAGEGKITLNFENTNIREVVKVILGDQLGVGYVISPAVQGGVTLQTGKPLRVDDLLPTLEMLLRMVGASMIEDDGLYRIIPRQSAMSGNLPVQLGDTSKPLPEGYSVRVVPLDYIAAAEMANILKPMIPEGSLVRIDSTRNLLILAGSGGELANMLETIRVFDVDWMSGLSVGFFSLQHTQVGEIQEKLQAIVGAEGSESIQGLIKLLPMEAVNGVLVVTPQKRYLDKIRTWIERLDQDELMQGGDEQQFYVYKIRNGEAAELAELLGRLFGERQAAQNRTGASIAPGERAVRLSSNGDGVGTESGSTSSVAAVSLTALEAGGSPVNPPSSVRIIADETRNLLLINASPRQYAKIEQVLERVDITPLQVLIEARIIEVTLQGDLQYGLQWFFKGAGVNGTSGRGSLDGTLDSASSAGLNSIFPGFNYSLVSTAGEVRALFSALAEDTSVKVLSSPSVMVLDNHEARIQVGDQVPIATQQQQNTSSSDSTIINSIQYRDTGIVLDVKPRVTPGGLVTLEVEQEVSDVSATQSSTLDSPTISTRKITSSIAVQNGHAVIMGGLIKDRDEDGSGGIPGLHDLPLVGWMFGQTSRVSNRTELVVMLVPRVVASSADATRLVEDYRQKLQGLEGEF